MESLLVSERMLFLSWLTRQCQILSLYIFYTIPISRFVAVVFPIPVLLPDRRAAPLPLLFAVVLRLDVVEAELLVLLPRSLVPLHRQVRVRIGRVQILECVTAALSLVWDNKIC